MPDTLIEAEPRSMLRTCSGLQAEAEQVAQQASAGTTAMQTALDGFEPRKRPFSPPPGSAPLQRLSPTTVRPFSLCLGWAMPLQSSDGPAASRLSILEHIESCLGTSILGSLTKVTVLH